MGVGDETADDQRDGLGLVREGGEDDAGLEGDGIEGLQRKGDDIVESAEAAGNRNYAGDTADQHDEEGVEKIEPEVFRQCLDDEPTHHQVHEPERQGQQQEPALPLHL